MAEKNIFGLAPFTQKEDEVQASIKSLEKQRENLEKRLRAEGIDPDTLGGEFDNRNLLEKALNLTPDQGVLMDFFEILQRPVQTVKGALISGRDGKTFIQGALDGLSGKTKTKGRDILFGREDTTGLGNPVANLLLDIGTDIAIDPLTYLPAGFLTKGFKKLTTKTKTEITQIAQIAQDSFIRSLGSNSDEILPKLKELAAKLDDSSVFVFKQDGANNFLDELVDIAKTTTRKIRFRGKTIEFSEEPLEQLIGFKGKEELVAAGNADELRKAAEQAVKDGDFYLTDVGKELAKRAAFRNKYGPLTKTLEYLQQRIGAIARGKALPDSPNNLLTEYGGFFRLNEMIKQFGPDIKVVATSTKSQIDDLVLLKRYGNSRYWTRVGVIEAKYIGESVGSFGKNMSLKLVGRPGKKIIQIAAGAKASQGYQESFLRYIKSIRLKNGETLESLLVRKAQGEEGLKIFDELANAGEKRKLKQMIYDLYKDQGMDIIYAQGKNGEGRFFRLQDVFEELDVSGTDIIVNRNGSITFKGGFKVDLKKVSDKGNYLLTEDLAKMFIQKEMKVTTSFLQNLATKDGFAAATARGLIKAGEAIGTLFDATFNFSEFGKKAYKFIIGESNLFVQRNAARVKNLRAEALARYGPKAESLIREIVEAGAYIGVDDAVRGIDSTTHIDDFLNYVDTMINSGLSDKIAIRSFAGGVTGQKAQAFVRKLNRLATYYGEDIGVDNLFEVVMSKGGKYTRLKFNGTIDDFARIKKDISKALTITTENPFLEFGEIQISAAAQQLLRADTAQGGANLIGKIQTLQDDILTTLVQQGGYTDIFSELAGTQGYVRHLMTKGALDAAQTSGVGAISRLAKPGTDFLKKRKYMGTIEELNAAFGEIFKMDTDFFNTSIFDTIEDLVRVTSRKVEQHRILKMVLTQPDKYSKSLFRVVNNTNLVKKSLAPNEVLIKSLDDELPALFKNLSRESRDEVAKIFQKRNILQGNKAVVINRNALDLLKRAERAYKDIPQLITFYDKFLNTWKGLTLITPGFHMRNLFGNMFNSYAVGMDLAAQSKYGLIAMNELNEYPRLVQKISQGLKLTASEQRVYDLVDGFTRQGLIQSHRGVRDLDQLKEMTEAAVKGGALKNTYNNAIRFNFNIAEKMDDVQRYMLYRWSLDKTGDASKAARTVTESLFDYTHLTGFEKDVMKRVFPFYTFMKNNFIFQAKNIFRNPKLYARTGRAYKYYLEDVAGYSPENLPDYATENMWLPIPIQVKKSDKKAIAFLKANLPLSDFMEIVENPFKKGVVSIAAPIKLPIELGLGRDLFTGRKITAFPGERNKLAKGGGVLGFLRDERGNLAITQMPIVQKIAAELGLRTPLNFGSAGLDALDTLLGYQGPQEGLADFAARMGLAGVQDMDRLKLTELYQDLEKLREIKKYYEQETGYQLPLLPRG